MAVFILHGLGGNAQENWFPWLKDELEARGEQVIVPSFSESLWPTFERWANEMDEFKNIIDNKTVFIGHSLGCPFGIKYLCDRGLHIKKFILTAPPFTNLKWDQLQKMMINFPPNNSKQCAEEFILFASNNDPYVPLEEIAQYEKLLKIKATVLPGREHLWQSEFSEVLDSLL